MNLSDHMKETADRMTGYTTGTLIVECGVVALLLDTGVEVPITASHCVDVRHDTEYVGITIEQALETFTVEQYEDKQKKPANHLRSAGFVMII